MGRMGCPQLTLAPRAGNEHGSAFAGADTPADLSPERTP
jgi:hypothetical protein